MKKIILALIIIIFLSFSTQTQAAWYDWFGWSKIKSVFIKENIGDKKETPAETKNQNQSEPKPDTTQTIPEEPKQATNTQNSSAEVESLKAEITTQKTNLDNLYKAHGQLVEDHNKLLKYTSDEILNLTNRYNNLLEAHNNLIQKHNNLVNSVSRLSVPRITDTSNLEKKVSNLENKASTLESKISNLESITAKICKNVFSYSRLLFSGCEGLSDFLITSTLESRIEKLERGY